MTILASLYQCKGKGVGIVSQEKAVTVACRKGVICPRFSGEQGRDQYFFRRTSLALCARTRSSRASPRLPEKMQKKIAGVGWVSMRKERCRFLATPVRPESLLAGYRHRTRRIICRRKCNKATSDLLPSKRDENSCLLAMRCKLQILVSLKVFSKESR